MGFTAPATWCAACPRATSSWRAGTRNVINRGGEKIGAAEIEGLLMAHPAVHEAALVWACLTRCWASEAGPVVVPRDPGLAAARLLRHLRGQGIATFKVPDRVVMTAALPHTAVGKVDKVVLRQALAAGADPSLPAQGTRPRPRALRRRAGTGLRPGAARHFSTLGLLPEPPHSVLIATDHDRSPTPLTDTGPPRLFAGAGPLLGDPMTIPRIAPYPMPVQWPTSCVQWPLRPTRAALLVHDMQAYFQIPYDTAQAPRVHALLAPCASSSSRPTRGHPVFYSGPASPAKPRAAWAAAGDGGRA